MLFGRFRHNGDGVADKGEGIGGHPVGFAVPAIAEHVQAELADSIDSRLHVFPAFLEELGLISLEPDVYKVGASLEAVQYIFHAMGDPGHGLTHCSKALLFDKLVSQPVLFGHVLADAHGPKNTALIVFELRQGKTDFYFISTLGNECCWIVADGSTALDLLHEFSTLMGVFPQGLDAGSDHLLPSVPQHALSTRVERDDAALEVCCNDHVRGVCDNILQVLLVAEEFFLQRHLLRHIPRNDGDGDHETPFVYDRKAHRIEMPLLPVDLQSLFIG